MVARIVGFHSYLRWESEWLCFTALQPFHLTKLPSDGIQHYTLGSGLLPESILLSACFPSSSLRIGVIVGKPLDVFVGCVRPAPQKS